MITTELWIICYFNLHHSDCVDIFSFACPIVGVLTLITLIDSSLCPIIQWCSRPTSPFAVNDVHQNRTSVMSVWFTTLGFLYSSRSSFTGIKDAPFHCTAVPATSIPVIIMRWIQNPRPGEFLDLCLHLFGKSMSKFVYLWITRLDMDMGLSIREP